MRSVTLPRRRPSLRPVGLQSLEPRMLLATTYDIATQWSDAANPNGAWSYRNGTSLLPHLSDWEPTSSGTLTGPQPAWVRKPQPELGHIPAWFKSVVAPTSIFDWKVGDVVVHSTDTNTGPNSGAANATWTAPSDGTINIRGAAWIGRDIGRGNTWSILKNGVQLTSGVVQSGDVYSRANPMNFTAGTGGATALAAISVKKSDVIELRFVATNPAAGELSGVKFAIDLDKPPTIVSLAASPNPVVKGNNITLTATGVADADVGDAVTKVEFYRDANNSGVLDPATDTKLGEDTSSAGGWTYTGSTAAFPTGTNRYFARAFDGDFYSAAVTTTGVVNTPPFAVLSAGKLTVTGTANADAIALAITGSVLVARLNTDSLSFSTAAITSIVVNAGAGNDRVTLGTSVTTSTRPATVSGGTGDDLLVGGAGAESLLGEGGNDTIVGGAGNDSLDGGDGNDLILAHDGGFDRINGGIGTDVLQKDNADTIVSGVEDVLL